MKLCFVTVGATASFEKLLEQVLSSAFLEALAQRHYTHLLLQYGKDGEKVYNEFLASGKSHHGLTVGGFDFKPSIEPEMIMTTERKQAQQERGLIISHAGMTFHLRPHFGGFESFEDLNVMQEAGPFWQDFVWAHLWLWFLTPTLPIITSRNLPMCWSKTTTQSAVPFRSAIAKAESQQAEVFSSRSGNDALCENISDELGFLD
ncbi:unnamed protein product [Penicillium olsonii]|nr:unnamed protein product [Penicillium olsonii]